MVEADGEPAARAAGSSVSFDQGKRSGRHSID